MRFWYIASVRNGTTGASSFVSVINTATITVVKTVKVGSIPYGVAITPNGADAYVTNYSSNSVSVINTTTDSLKTVTVGKGPTGVAIR